MKRNKYFIGLIDKIHNFHKFVTVMAFTAKEAIDKAFNLHELEGYVVVESITRIV